MAEQPLRVELEQESDGRWLAAVVELPGVLAYGANRDEALARAGPWALRVIADRLEHAVCDRFFRLLRACAVAWRHHAAVAPA